MMKLLIPSLLEDFEEALACCQRAPTKTSSFGVSVSEDAKNMYLAVPLPGIKSEEIQILMEKESRTLSIQAKSKEEKKEGIRYHVEAERVFSYKIPLNCSIDMEGKIDAITKDGILNITLPKSTEQQPRRIDVKVA